jgi:site-specific recombinase XerD
VPQTLEGRIEAFLASRQGLSEASQDNYRNVLSLFQREGGDLASFLAGKGPVTRQTYYRHLRVFYNWLERRGWIQGNPCDHLSLPTSPRREAHFFRREEIAHLVQPIRAHAT